MEAKSRERWKKSPILVPGVPRKHDPFLIGTLRKLVGQMLAAVFDGACR